MGTAIDWDSQFVWFKTPANANQAERNHPFQKNFNAGLIQFAASIVLKKGRRFALCWKEVVKSG
jgi:hypothetical protein